MNDFHLQLADMAVPTTFLPRFLTRLRKSSSETLRERLWGWSSGPLRNIGLSFSNRFDLLNSVVRRINRSSLARLDAELKNREGDLLALAQAGTALPLADRTLYREILLDVDSFLFECRAAVELLKAFLLKLLAEVFDRHVDEDELVAELVSAGVESQWIGELWRIRDLMAHQRTFSLAVRIISSSTLNWELVVQQDHPMADGALCEPVEWATLQRISDGLRDSLKVVEEWLENQVEAYEADHS